jgi:APA family basic amino acid/polyamine antiporter
LLVIAIGAPHWGEQPLLGAPQGLGGLAAATALAFFAFLGFEQLGNLAEEMRAPERDLPRAILLAIALATGIYVLVAVSAVSLVGWEALATSSAPLVASVAETLGPVGAGALHFIALAATANTALLLMISGSRSIHGMARSGVLPAFLESVGGRHTPHHAILAVVVMIGLVLPLGDIALVAQVANFAMLASFALVNVSASRVLTGPSARPRLAALWRLQPYAGALSCVALATMTGGPAIGLGLGLTGLGFLYSYRRQCVPPRSSGFERSETE